MFWRNEGDDSLLPWKDGKRILHLTRNERSGADKWFSHVLNSCREGDLQEDDFNFLHGYPTEGAIKFWYEHREDSNWIHDDKTCSYTKYQIMDHWQEWPGASGFECKACWRERKRRARVLHLQSHQSHARARLTDPDFAESVLITQYNMAVFYFAQQRAINFARTHKRQAFWIQAIDTVSYTHLTLPTKA